MPHSTDTAVDQWRTVITNAHGRRLDSSQISHVFEALSTKVKVASDDLVKVVLSLRSGDTYDKDPLVIRYVEALLRTGCVTPSSLLLGLLQDSRYVKTGAQAPLPTIPLPTFEQRAFHLVREIINDRLHPNAVWKLHRFVLAVTRWLSIVAEYEIAQQLELGPLHTISTSNADMYEALAMLAYTVFSNEHFREIERQPWWKDRRLLVATEIAKFDLNVLQLIHTQMAGHLQKLITARPFLETDNKGRPIFSCEQIIGLPDSIPIVQSRGGLFIWLTACLYVRPYINDSTIRKYLLIRYHDDAQNAALSLVMASFDVLINSAPGQGTSHLQKPVRSFICNRLPLLLSSLATLMPAGVIGSYIAMALDSIELGPVTPLGTTTAETKETVKKTKLEFLQACVLHTLFTDTSAASILPGQNITAPKASRYNRTTLLSQCTANITRLDSLTQELGTMSGNVGAIAGCVADLITTLCNNKDTMTLKNACAILLKRVSSLDYVFQHIAPATLSIPLCHLLNDWTHDQDQTEFQPVFEEFAVILLFLSAVVHRNNLSGADLALTDNDSFAIKFLFGGVGTTSTADLSEEQSKQLFNWTQGLYATDEQGDTLGITDEVYSQCPPQAFYILVPTLFEQTAFACKCKALTVSAMKGGLEFLLEPFLMPSLIGGLHWVAETSWADAEDTNVRLHMLEKLLASSSSSQEVQMMHKAIMTIVGKPLEASLQHLLRMRPEKKREVSKLLDILKPYAAQPGPHHSSLEQLPAWTSVDGGLIASLRSSIRDLAVWSSNESSNAASKYSPAIIWEAIRIIGPSETLNAIVAELQHQTSIGSASLAVDLCTAIVCAPSHDAQLSLSSDAVDLNSIGLRECLRLLIGDEHALLKMPYKLAEAFINLSRSVEAQSGMSQLASQLDLVDMSLPSGETADQVMMQDLGLAGVDTSLDDVTTAAALGSGLDSSFALADESTLDLNKAANTGLMTDAINLDQNHDIFADLGMDLTGQHDLLGPNNFIGDQSLTTNAEDDIFADLDMGNLGDEFDFS